MITFLGINAPFSIAATPIKTLFPYTRYSSSKSEGSVTLNPLLHELFPFIKAEGGIYLNISTYVILAVIYFAVFRKKEPIDLFGKVATSVPAAAFLCGIFLAAALNIFAEDILEVLKRGDELAEAATFSADISFIPGLILYVVCSPVCEELCFRWLTYGRIRRCIGVKLAVFTSALFFGIFHGNPVQGVYAFIMGIVMAVIYERTGAFLTTLLFHVGANAVIYVAAFVEKDGAELNGTVAAIGCLLASLPLLWYLCREKNKEDGKKRTGKINGSK